MTKTFMKITNKEVYEEIKSLREDNNKGNQEIIKHLIETNGKVKLNRWIGTTAISLVVITLGFLINHLKNAA